MTRTEWIAIMKFPEQWEAWGLLPDAYVGAVLARYERGHEQASEHDRHGAFQWWLKQDPSEDTLVKLALLSWLDPDPLMGGYVRECISKAKHFSPVVANALHQSAQPQQGVQRDGHAFGVPAR